MELSDFAKGNGDNDEDEEQEKEQEKKKEKEHREIEREKEREKKQEDVEKEENQASDDTCLTCENTADTGFDRDSACVDIKKQPHLQKERFSLMFSEYQEIIDQMGRSLEKAEAANLRYQNVLRLLDEQYNCRFQGNEKISKLAKPTRAHSSPYCELALSRGRSTSEPVRVLRKRPKCLHSIDKSPKRLSVSNFDVAERPKAYSLDALKPLESSPAKSDSSSDSSRSSGSVNATPHFGSKALAKKPPPVVPRLDLSSTWARTGIEVETSLSALQQKSSQLQYDQFENPNRLTSRRTNSARLISADDHFGSSTNSAKMMLLRIKCKAKSGSFGRETIQEASVTCGNNTTSIIVGKQFEDTGQIGDEPSIQEIEELPVMQSSTKSIATESICMDEADQTPVHVLQRSMSPSVAESCNPDLEMNVTYNAAQSTSPKAHETLGIDLVNLQAFRQETRTQILLWSIGEKLSTLQTLNNTMFLWEDHPAKCGTLMSGGNVDLILNSLTAAKESQRRLFDSLDGVPGIPRRAICCSAVRELVRAYPPERLVPTSFINNHLVTKFLQHTVLAESFLKLVSIQTLRSAQDFEAAEFWQALVHHVVSVTDHKMTTVEQSAKEFAEVILHEMRKVDIVGDAKLAELKLTAFLTQCFRLQPIARCHTIHSPGKELDSTDLPVHVSNIACTQDCLAASQIEEIALGRQVYDTFVLRANNNNSNAELLLVASKHSRRSSLLSIFNSLKFWKRKPQALATESTKHGQVRTFSNKIGS